MKEFSFEITCTNVFMNAERKKHSSEWFVINHLDLLGGGPWGDLFFMGEGISTLVISD